MGSIESCFTAPALPFGIRPKMQNGPSGPSVLLGNGCPQVASGGSLPASAARMLAASRPLGPSLTS